MSLRSGFPIIAVIVARRLQHDHWPGVPTPPVPPVDDVEFAFGLDLVLDGLDRLR